MPSQAAIRMPVSRSSGLSFSVVSASGQRTILASRFISWVTPLDGGSPAVFWPFSLVSLVLISFPCDAGWMLSKKVSIDFLAPFRYKS
jgi:hypothetical protein